MRTRSLFQASVVGVALLGLAGSASAVPIEIPASNTYYSVDPLAPVTVNVACPTQSGYSHKLLVGGGFVASHDFAVYENRKVGSTWQISAFNMADYAGDVTAQAECLYWNGNPTSPTVVSSNGSGTTIRVGTTGTSTTPSCASGTVVVSGGYLSTYISDYVPTYIYNGRSGSAWKVSGYNPSGVSQKVTAQVNCLKGWKVGSKSAASSQSSAGIEPSETYAEALCTGTGAISVGGGWSITAAHSNFPYDCLVYGPTDFACDMDYEGGGGVDNSSLAFAECLTAP